MTIAELNTLVRAIKTNMFGDKNSDLLGLLCVAFIILKLTGVISWSWWWVLSPIWIPAAIAIVLLVLLFKRFKNPNKS